MITLGSGFHRLEHIQRFFASDLADDDAIGAHTERVDDQLALPYGTLPFDVGGPRLQTYDVPLFERELRGVLDGHDALAIGYEARQRIQQRRLTCAGAARHDHIQPRSDDALQEVQHRLGE